MFKGYSKVSTSDKTMRIVKREGILSLIAGVSTLIKLDRDQAKDRLSDSDKNNNLDWALNNLTELTIFEYESNKDYFDWKVEMIKRTEWLSNLEIWKENDIHYARWHDTRKLRIYYKWMHRSGKRTYEKILKYMYSPLFPAVLVMDRGALGDNKELLIDLGLNYGVSADMMCQWFQDILNISPQVIKMPDKHYLSFDQITTKKLLHEIKPVVQNIPSMYERIYNSSLMLTK